MEHFTGCTNNDLSQLKTAANNLQELITKLCREKVIDSEVLRKLRSQQMEIKKNISLLTMSASDIIA
jgi:hypothetical protein